MSELPVEFDPNEDLQDQIDQRERERTGKRRVYIATQAGWISFWSTIMGSFVGAASLALITLTPFDSGEIIIAAFGSIVVGQLATIVDYVVLLRLKISGTDESIRKPLLLGLPGAVVSGLISGPIMYFMWA